MAQESTEHQTMSADIAELTRLDALRKHIQESLNQAGYTLIWFAEQYRHNQTIPLNVWKRLDRPLPKPSKTLGPVFDVWHAILRAERALRDRGDDKLLDKLRTTAAQLLGQLPKLELPTPGNPDEKWELVRRFVSEEIYGTFNPLTAAAILRSEVFPERSQATPSYLAGYVLFSELNVALTESQAANVTAMADRPPRLALIAPGVHSVILYVEHLRRRADLFKQITSELGAYTKTCGQLQDFTSASLDTKDAVDGYVRGMSQRLSGVCEESARLVLAPKQFFKSLAESLAALANSEKGSCEHERIVEAIQEARKKLEPTNETQIKQQKAYELSTHFAPSAYAACATSSIVTFTPRASSSFTSRCRCRSRCWRVKPA